MVGSIRNPSHTLNKNQKQEGKGFAVSFKPENFIPGLVIGFILGLFLDLSKPVPKTGTGSKKSILLSGTHQQKQLAEANNTSDEELKMVLIVRQDLRMGAGKIASQCAHAATGMYSELLQCRRQLLRQWEVCGQPKIVLTCKNQNEMNRLKETADSIGLPTFVVADAGRTQVSAGSKTVLAIGPGSKASIDSVTGRLRLL